MSSFLIDSPSHLVQSFGHWAVGTGPLIKKKIKFSSYIRKFRVEQLLSHIWLTASSYIGKHLRISHSLPMLRSPTSSYLVVDIHVSSRYWTLDSTQSSSIYWAVSTVREGEACDGLWWIRSLLSQQASPLWDISRGDGMGTPECRSSLPFVDLGHAVWLRRNAIFQLL